MTHEPIKPNRPVIAITMGDAAGVGPEIIMKTLAHADLYQRCKPSSSATRSASAKPAAS